LQRVRGRGVEVLVEQAGGRLGEGHSPRLAAPTRARLASSSTSRTAARCTWGWAVRNSSSVLPAASQLNSTHTATRVPAKTAAPLWISGSGRYAGVGICGLAPEV